MIVYISLLLRIKFFSTFSFLSKVRYVTNVFYDSFNKNSPKTNKSKTRKREFKFQKKLNILKYLFLNFTFRSAILEKVACFCTKKSGSLKNDLPDDKRMIFAAHDPNALYV